LRREELGEIKAGFMQTLSAGVDHIPINMMPETLTIASNVGAFAEPMAEHTMAMFLALAKRLYINHHRMKEIFDQLSETLTSVLFIIFLWVSEGLKVTTIFTMNDNAFPKDIFSLEGYKIQRWTII